MDESALSIPPRQLELRQAQQGILSLWCKRIIDNYVLVVTLRIRRVRCKACSPEQSLRVQPSRRRGCFYHGIDQRSPGHAVSIANQRLGPYKNRIGWTWWRLRDRQRGRAR